MKLFVQTRIDTPIYEQLFSQLRAQILSGQIEAHYCLPSIRLVARELTISVIPVKTASDMLEQQGYIYTVQGKGCFVAEIADRETQRIRLATDSVRTSVFNCKQLGFSAEEINNIVTATYNENDIDNK